MKLAIYTGRKLADQIPGPDGTVIVANTQKRCAPLWLDDDIADLLFSRNNGWQPLQVSETGIYVGSHADVQNFDTEISDKLPHGARALFIRDNGAGDVLLSTPALRQFMRKRPDIEVDYATAPHLLAIARCTDALRYGRVMSVHDINFERQNYDLVVNWANVVEDYSLPRNRCHRVDSFFLHLGMQPPKAEHDRRINIEFPHYLKSLRDSFGTRIGRTRTPIIGYVVGAASWVRTWPHENGVEMTAILEREIPHAQIVLIDQSELAGWEAANVMDMCGMTTDFSEAAVLLSLCDMVVTPDTGLAHVAGALGIPMVTISADIPPDKRFAYYEDVISLTADGLVDCYPCWSWQTYHTDDKKYGRLKSCNIEKVNHCMQAIAPRQVVEAVKELEARRTRMEVADWAANVAEVATACL